MRVEDVGVVVSTLVPDPMTCAAGNLLFASVAAGEAGIENFAMWPHHIAAPDRPDEAMVEAWTGRVAVLETASRFAHGATDRFVAEATYLIDLASRVGAPMVAVCSLQPSLGDGDGAVEGLRQLAKLAAERDIGVSLEFIPWSGVPDLATAWRLITAAGEPNLSLVLDTWHWHRQPGGPAYQLLESIPGERISYVQICDAGEQPAADLMREAMTARLLPGDGVVDFRQLGASLDRIGATPLYMTEVYNSELADRGAHEMAKALHSSIAALDFVASAA